MTKINVVADCGNSPKNIFVKDFNIAFGERNIDYIIDRVSNDIEWTIIGDKFIQGKDNFIDVLKQRKTEALEITIDIVMSHGKVGSVSGEILFPNGEQYGYCDVYEFTNAKGSGIKSIRSYLIKIT